MLWETFACEATLLAACHSLKSLGIWHAIHTPKQPYIYDTALSLMKKGNIMSLGIYAFNIVAWKFWKKTKMVRPHEMDLQSGRREF